MNSSNITDFIERPLAERKVLLEGLLHSRDLVVFGARRRHGKTNFCLNMGLALAAGLPDFLGYLIPQPRRVFFGLFEDDEDDIQRQLHRMTYGWSDERKALLATNTCIITRNDFLKAKVPVNIDNERFIKALEEMLGAFKPELMILDNVSMLVRGNYNDAKRIDNLTSAVFHFAQHFNAAQILPAHPRKRGKVDPDDAVSLETEPEQFVEEIMGSSHLINSCGTVWAMERREDKGNTLFMGGRQRSDGHWGHRLLYLDDNKWLQILGPASQLSSIINTKARFASWGALGDTSWKFDEGFQRVKATEGGLRSRDAYATWIRDMKQLSVVLYDAGQNYSKAPGLPIVTAPSMVQQPSPTVH